MKATMRQVLTGVAAFALAAGMVSEAFAASIPFSNTAGFRSGSAGAPAPTVQGLNGTAAVAGQGGLEFFNAITGPPGPPVGDGTTPTSDMFKVVGWGCTPSLTGPPPSATCANGGTIGVTTTPATNPFGSASRSALEINGLFGNIVDTDWTDVALLRHQNSVISGNALATVQVAERLRLGVDPTPLSSDDTIDVRFLESLNRTPCSALAAPTAPVNPLSSICDDFFFVAGLDLNPIFIPAGIFDPNALIISFRLDARDGALVCTGQPGQPAACGGYSGTDILIFTEEADINSLAVQARLTVVGVPEPASLLLLGAGLFGGSAVAAIRRRRAR